MGLSGRPARRTGPRSLGRQVGRREGEVGMTGGLGAWRGAGAGPGGRPVWRRRCGDVCLCAARAGQGALRRQGSDLGGPLWSRELGSMALGVLSVFGLCDSEKHPVLRGTVLSRKIGITE